MREATELLVEYARCHRDRRNIASHCIGIPLVVFACGVLLARWRLPLGGAGLSAAWAVAMLASAWYLSRGRWPLGLAASVFIAVLVALAHAVADGSTTRWLAWSLGGFALGGALQSVGHWLEGCRPAVLDDPLGPLVGPMFVAALALFALGWGAGLRDEIDGACGPTYRRDLRGDGGRTA